MHSELPGAEPPRSPNTTVVRGGFLQTPVPLSKPDNPAVTAPSPSAQATSPSSGTPNPSRTGPSPEGSQGGDRPPAPSGSESRALKPFGEGQVRTPLLGVRSPLGATPRPTPEQLREAAQYIDPNIVDPAFTLDVIVGRPRLLLLKQTPTRIQIADDRIANYNLLSERELSLLGLQVGTTVLNLWFPDVQDKTKQKVLSYLVNVLPDPEYKQRLEQAMQALQEEINRTFPDSVVSLRLVGDKVVVMGQAKDIYEARIILDLVRANVPRTYQTVLPATLNINLDLGAVGFDNLPRNYLQQFLTPGFPEIIDALRVPGEQQVLLKVIVAEINRSAARSIGVNWSITDNEGRTIFSHTTNSQNLLANLTAAFDTGQITASIEALRTLNYARTLAEPVATVMNGNTAVLLVGGQFPVPVVTGFTAAGLQGVSFVPHGVLLFFTPFVLDRDKIRLTIWADVSEVNPGLGAVFAGVTQIPGLSNRTISTTVELREGQTLAIGGLITNKLTANGNRVPYFGEIPFVGRLLSHDRITQYEQELVILVTPELVHPLEPNEVPALPGSDVFEPGDLEFFLYGRLESRRSYDFRSSVMTDIHRMKRYRECSQIFILGPHGHSDLLPK
ncbi:MAG: pilus assembly protein N-terminal domain-containing protein [Gemmatales bacterium]|nr:pilus assembly protein N-terminal domain-containing protein [Gemmatales bacterium]MDW7995325.1 pilus assembly protein N-terminal domain-containing protein [Gemmatales bacterium]